MRRILVVVFFSLLHLATRGQEHYLDLVGPLPTLPRQPLAVAQVLDGRAREVPIGLVYRGASNRASAVLFRHDLATDLTSFLQAQLPAAAGRHPVVLCVRQLRVGEVPGGRAEKAIADLTLDVYTRLPDGYHFVRTTGASTSGRPVAAPGSHSARLVLLLAECLTQLDAADWPDAATRPALALGQLRGDAPAPLAAGGPRGPGPAILRQAPRRGIYYRFEQFLANEPDTGLTFHLDTLKPAKRLPPLAKSQWAGVARVRPLVPAGAGQWQVPPGAWGFCDGRQLFVQHHQQFFPLHRQGSFFTFVGEAPLDLEYARALAEAQVRAQSSLVARVAVPDRTAEPLAYALDIHSGGRAPLADLPPRPRADTAYVYIYRPATTITPERVPVYVDGREVGALRPGEYLELPWPASAKPCQLCLGGLRTANPCQYLVPNPARQSYLKVDLAATPGPWQWVPPAQAEADLDALDQRRP